jgi:uncharacterized protein
MHTVEQPMVDKKEQTWAMFSHLSALSLFVGIPFGNLIGPLVLWLVGRNEGELADDQGKEALNFQLSVMLYIVLLAISVVGLVLVPVAIVADIVLTIIATVRASRGEYYRYPWTIRFVK